MKRILLWSSLITIALAQAYAVTLPEVTTVSALATLTESGGGALQDGDTVVVDGYYTPGDGGGGTFIWSTSDTSTPDMGVVFAGSATGNWLRNGTNLNVRMFGAKGDGIAEDGDAIQRAFDAAESRNYPQLEFNGGRFKVSVAAERQVGRVPGQTTYYFGHPYYPPPVLVLGKLPPSAHAAHPLQILGGGAVLFTEQEFEHPILLLIQPNFKGLTIQDITFAHTQITTTSILPTADTPVYTYVEGDSGAQELAFVVGKGTDTSEGLQRQGVQISHFPADESGVVAPLPVDQITFREVTFYDCHSALGAEGTTGEGDSETSAFGILNVDHCSFLYPTGAASVAQSTIIAAGLPPQFVTGGGQALRVGRWINTLNVVECYFDGASNDDLSAEQNPEPVDGFVWANPVHLICHDNTVRHFGVEGLFHISDAEGYSNKTSEIYDNNVDGAPPIGREVYGGVAIRADDTVANINGNTMTNCSQGLILETSPGVSNLAGCTIQNNTVTSPPIGGPYGGLDIQGVFQTITDNNITFLVGGANNGILLGGGNATVEGNSISNPGAPPTTGDGSIGIIAANNYDYFDNNSTKFFSAGIRQTPGLDSINFIVDRHISNGDLIPVLIDINDTWRHQRLTYVANGLDVLGNSDWYAIGLSNIKTMAGTLTISNGADGGDAADSSLSSASFNYGAGFQGTSMKDISSSPGRGGTGCASIALLETPGQQIQMFARLRKTPSPYSVSLDTESESVVLFAKPQLLDQVTSCVAGSGQSTITTVSTHTVGSSVGAYLYLFNSPDNYQGGGYIGSFQILSSPTTTSYVVSGIPATVPTQELLQPLTANNENFKTLGFFSDNFMAAPGAPTSVVPDYFGQFYFDTSTGSLYVSDSTSSGAWLPVTSPNPSLSSLQLGTGTSGAPAFSFSGDLGTGFYSAGSGKLGVSVGGSQIALFDNEGLLVNGVSSGGTQSATQLGYGFAEDPTQNTGFYLAGPGDIGFSALGVNRMDVNSNGLVVSGNVGLEHMRSASTATNAFGTASIAANGSKDVIVTVTGAQVNDTVLVSAPASATRLLIHAFISSANTVTLRAENFSTGAIVPPSNAFRVIVLSFSP